jgi:hypothetical protein
MTDENRARFQQIQNTNLFHQETVARWNREDTDREQNTTWDHNYKYEVLHDRDAQWGAADSERQQRLNLDLDRYHLDQDKFANQRQEQQFRQTNVSTPQLFTLAQKLLQQIQSEANEANRRIDWATKNKKATPGGGISDPMIQSYQNNVDAYNQVVQELSARGGSMGHIYKPWQGPDINATNAYAAGSTAQQATAAQGQPATSPVAGMQQVGVDSRNNKPVYKSASGGYFYQDGTPVPK